MGSCMCLLGVVCNKLRELNAVLIIIFKWIPDNLSVKISPFRHLFPRNAGGEFRLGCIHYVWYRGDRRFFFQRLVFYIPPPPPPKVHTNFHNPPSNQPKNEYPPSSLTKNIKINICIIVHYICFKSQETCLMRTSREL